MEEVEVEVLEAEVLEGVLDGERDVLRVVVELEELGGDPELVTGDASLGDTLTDLGLVACGQLRPGTPEQLCGPSNPSQGRQPATQAGKPPPGKADHGCRICLQDDSELSTLNVP